jgi:hypothetical protein
MKVVAAVLLVALAGLSAQQVIDFFSWVASRCTDNHRDCDFVLQPSNGNDRFSGPDMSKGHACFVAGSRRPGQNPEDQEVQGGVHRRDPSGPGADRPRRQRRLHRRPQTEMLLQVLLPEGRVRRGERGPPPGRDQSQDSQGNRSGEGARDN